MLDGRKPAFSFLFSTLCLLFSVLWFSSPAHAAFDLKIISAAYNQHFNPGEVVTFTVQVKNNEATAQFAEVDISLTNLSNSAELTLTPVLTQTIQPGQLATLTASYSTVSVGQAPSTSAVGFIHQGTFTIAFTLVDGNGDRSDQVRGKFPLHVGSETESIRVFPELIHLGTVPAGRFLHPTPIEVTWSFFRFNQLRLDQPFVIRLYTDNATRYVGVPGSLRRGSPGGLVSANGRYTIPVKFWSLNAGPDLQETGWDSPIAGPPPVDDDNAWLGPPLLEGSRHFGGASWVRIKDRVELAASPFGWTRGEGIIGQDPHDNRYASDINPTGDFTLASPFTFYIATEAGAAAVEGTYTTTLVVELWTP